MKSYVVIGLGLFGQALARQLCALGAEVLAMDVRSDLVQQVANDVTHSVVGDAQDRVQEWLVEDKVTSRCAG